jgi:hypothetical protein
MLKAIDPAIYDILTISRDGKEATLKGKTTSFDYYESLLSPNVTATMTFVDTGGSIIYDQKYDRQERVGSVYNALPITGGEKVSFKIDSSLGVINFENNPFFVNGAINPGQESQRETIVLSLFSKGAKLNQESTVYKKYQGNISTSVTTLIEQFLDTDKVSIEKTGNSFSFTGNSDSVFDVICWLAAKSIADKDSAGFFFYETKEGFNFKSIDSLISQPPITTYYKSGALRAGDNDNKILSSNITKNQNILNALKTGVYHSRNIYFNPKTFKEEEVIYTFNDGKLKKSLGKSAEAPVVDNFTRTHYDIMDVGTLEKTVKGTDNNDPKNWQWQTTMRYNLLFSQVLNIQVPCNPQLKAGDTINCDFEIISQDNIQEGSSDPVQSGKYLIVDLCHHYEPTRSITSLTLARDSYGLYTNKNKS